MKTLTALLLLITLPVLGQVSFSGAKLSGFSVGPPPPSAVVTNVTAGLTNWWKFDEGSGTLAADSIAGNNIANITSHPQVNWIASGKIGACLDFNGGYGVINTNFGIEAAAFTAAFWLYQTSAVVNATIAYDSGGGANGFFILMPSGSDMRLDIVTSGNDEFRTAAIALPLSTWTHFIMTWDGAVGVATNIHIYTNDVEVSYGTSQTGTGVHSASSSTTPTIAQGTALFKGYIDDVRFYTRVVDSTERSYIYQYPSIGP